MYLFGFNKTDELLDKFDNITDLIKSKDLAKRFRRINKRKKD